MVMPIDDEESDTNSNKIADNKYSLGDGSSYINPTFRELINTYLAKNKDDKVSSSPYKVKNFETKLVYLSGNKVFQCRDPYVLYQQNLANHQNFVILWPPLLLHLMHQCQRTEVQLFHYQTNTASKKKWKYFMNSFWHHLLSQYGPAKCPERDLGDPPNNHRHITHLQRRLETILDYENRN